jgi:hypothetical protein
MGQEGIPISLSILIVGILVGAMVLISSIVAVVLLAF